MKRNGIVTVDSLFKISLLSVCSFLFFPSPLTCSDFIFRYKEFFILLLFLILVFILALLKKKNKVIRLNKIDFWVIVFFLYMLIDFRCFNVECSGKIIALLLTYFAFRNISVRFLYVCFILIILSSLVQIVYCWLGFVHPWESLGDIEGIFHNTGIWGGFVALCAIGVVGIVFFY